MGSFDPALSFVRHSSPSPLLLTSTLPTSLAAFLSLLSHSTQHLPCPMMKILCHFNTSCALFFERYAICLACWFCLVATAAMRGCSAISEAKDSVGGIGISSRDVNCEAVAGYKGASARTIASLCGAPSPGWASETSGDSGGFKRSACRDSVAGQLLVWRTCVK